VERGWAAFIPSSKGCQECPDVSDDGLDSAGIFVTTIVQGLALPAEFIRIMRINAGFDALSPKRFAGVTVDVTPLSSAPIRCRMRTVIGWLPRRAASRPSSGKWS
jgi:hypothetical protein